MGRTDAFRVGPACTLFPAALHFLKCNQCVPGYKNLDVHNWSKRHQSLPSASYGDVNFSTRCH